MNKTQMVHLNASGVTNYTCRFRLSVFQTVSVRCITWLVSLSPSTSSTTTAYTINPIHPTNRTTSTRPRRYHHVVARAAPAVPPEME